MPTPTTSDDSKTAVLTERHGQVLLITLNRPDARNAINGAMSAGLWDAAETLQNDPGLNAAVLCGAGPSFCAGMDLKAFARGEDLAGFGRFVRRGTDKPLVGAVEGFALGGGLELALTCDVLVAARGAKLGLSEVKVGLFAAGGGLLRLPRRIGLGKAMEMVLTGEPITADDAAAHGLVTRLTDPGQALSVALDLATQIAGNAPMAIAASKRLLKLAVSSTEQDFWAAQPDLYRAVFSSNDAKEGPRAFVEKRAPKWQGS